MTTTLIILVVTTALVSYYLYPKFPFMMRRITGYLLLLAVATNSILIFSPIDLMERLPSGFANVGHPLVLGILAASSVILFLSCAVGSLAGCLTVLRYRQRHEDKQDTTLNGE